MDEIQDDILRKLIITHDRRAEQNASHRLDQLISAVDLENINAKDVVLTVHDVPGGSISFLFHKSSSMLELPSRAAGEEDK